MEALAGIPALPRVSGDHAAKAVHAHLRRLILEAVIAPGTTLTQVELALRLGVSRTPVREAMRMLEEEGLLVAEPQKRARVIGFDPVEVEAIYVQRVLLEGLGIRITAAAADEQEIQRVRGLLADMHGISEKRDLETWEQAHRAFHLALVAGAGDRLVSQISGFIDRTELYRRVFWEDQPRAWSLGAGEHQAIFAAFEAGDVHRAAAELAIHLARTGLTLLVNFAPYEDPRALRAALETIVPDAHLRRADTRGSVPWLSGEARAGRSARLRGPTGAALR